MLRGLLIIVGILYCNYLLSQIEVPETGSGCKIHSKNNFTYCLNEKNYKTQWTALQIKGSDIENKVYIPFDQEFFKDIPVEILPVWQKIEMQTRMWAMEFDSVYVTTGRMHIGLDSLGADKEGYYKAILKGCQGDALGILVYTDEPIKNVREYCIPINELENISGINFFPSLNSDLQDIFEAEFKWEFWPLTIQ